MVHTETMEQYARYRTALTLNLLVMGIQAGIVLFATQSLGLIGDTIHALADNLLLIGTTIILYFEALGATKQHGRKRVLARIGGVLLIGSGIGIVLEGVSRFHFGTPLLSGWWMIAGAVIAVTGNYFAHRIIADGPSEEDDHLHRANILHLLGDLGISLAVLLGGVAMMYFRTPHIDTVLASVLVAPWMIWRGVGVLRYQDPEERVCAHVTHHSHPHHK